ncbi:carbohydrate porin [Rhodoblastus acidophilus]|uniref:Carbohydrate porin n=1 Tax=Rhodoblastus acidophilus TaxID=1074 RepID=A0A6N8DHS4_RHOAC|nr:carbohydrate porin [Rhodoblastus acidophilus]MCW2272807.1 porin [Rhodoblastus acidophilus]MTV29718.1 carbohydrate porin [Rhodoblastus acidophilus]
MKFRPALFHLSARCLRETRRTALVVALGMTTAASAQEASQRDAADDVNTPLSSAANIGQQSVGALLPEPLASWNGLRPALAKKGLTFAFTYQSDPMANVSGGLKTGPAYIGRVQAVANFDPEPLTGWKGALFQVSTYQIHGVGLTGAFIGSYAAVSDIEALATTRLNEVWVEQKLTDWLSLRIGQLAVDSEFFLSPYLGIGIGGTFGWPPIATANLPGGGVVYPFATPAARLKITPSESVALLAAVFNGDPAGPGVGDPQKRNPYGLNFRIMDAPFAIAEAQIKYGADTAPGTLRIGAWSHFGRFADERFSSDGRSIWDPNGSGAPLQHSGDFSVYGVLDRQVLQKPDKTDDGVFAFGRIAWAPPDRNIIDFYADGGLSFQGMVPDRPADQFAFLATFARVSPAARAADLDANFFLGQRRPAHTFESILEATYSYKAATGLLVQPSLQYVIHPGGGADPHDPLRPIPNALVVGVRTTIQY